MSEVKKCKLYFGEHPDCQQCVESNKDYFRYIEAKKGERLEFKDSQINALVFILTGEAYISCNEFTNKHFQAGQMCLMPTAAYSLWEVIEDASAIILNAENKNMLSCDRLMLQNYAGNYLDIVPSFDFLEIRPRLAEFLQTLKNYIQDGVRCKDMQMIKNNELSFIFRAYYSADELAQFFLPMVSYSREFETFIMQNYLKMKGVKEFVDLSGMNVSTFNRRFRTLFGESPYKWMLKQKSKHIMHQLTVSDKSISDIMREFAFSDASHFNRYCKIMFGAAPTVLRARIKAEHKR